MRKHATLPTIALLVLTGFGGALVATPSIASGFVSGSIGDCTAPSSGKDSDWNFAMMEGELRDLGIAYKSIDKFGNCFLVRAKNPDGSTELQFYDPQSLHRVK